ncbi:hypothetical protein [Umezawaea tangerina]|uniref:Uncharacterized protein n=1 Tax=Umezawaea tangerina TaxID=84725 RepID=A0A2T0T977_9PSEU|nr:hypothetical protein [Umezawaea tangerina]PRY42188.1 hypothetical protein CLV43_10418 [Umezawaea tangerina]
MGRWRATESDRVTVDGSAYPPRSAELAVVGGRAVVSAGTEVVSAGTVSAGTGAESGWRHECGARPRAAYASADRLLVLTDSLDYHAWGHLGPALLLDLETGERVAELRGERAAAVSGGRFLLGLEGYGTFSTWLHDRDGALLTTWHSYGHYVVDPDGVRVVECDRRRPTRSAVVRLLPDGSVERGHALHDGQVAAPVVLPDGTVVVVDGGTLLAVGPDLRGEVLVEVLDVGGESWRFTTTLDWDAGEGALLVTVVERTRDVPVVHKTHRVLYALRPVGPAV